MNEEGDICCLCKRRDIFWVEMFSNRFCRSCSGHITKVWCNCPKGAVFTYGERVEPRAIWSWARMDLTYREKREFLTGKAVPVGAVCVGNEVRENTDSGL